jgi:hypothetical protein
VASHPGKSQPGSGDIPSSSRRYNEEIAADLMNCAVAAALNPIVFGCFGQYKPARTRVAFATVGIIDAQIFQSLS